MTEEQEIFEYWAACLDQAYQKFGPRSVRLQVAGVIQLAASGAASQDFCHKNSRMLAYFMEGYEKCFKKGESELGKPTSPIL